MYIVLENISSRGPALPKLDDPTQQSPLENIHGPYKTIKDAELAIIRIAEHDWDNADDSKWEEPEKWASRCIICKVVKTVIPSPLIAEPVWRLKKAPDYED